MSSRYLGRISSQELNLPKIVRISVILIHLASLQINFSVPGLMDQIENMKGKV